MNGDKDTEILQSIIQYYRAKCSKLEYEFLLYKIKTEQRFNELQNESGKESVSDAKDA